MLKLSRKGVGLLTSQYKSVLRKCLLLNMIVAGSFAFCLTANADSYDSQTSPRFANMGMTLPYTDTETGISYDEAFVHGSDGYNIKEVMNGESSVYNDAWIRNKATVKFGYQPSGETVSSTTVEHKHNITILDGSSINGGGVISNGNNDTGTTSLDIYRTQFKDNSATRFLNESSGVDHTGVAFGGALLNYSKNQASIIASTFESNYVMHFNQASGGAIYNGSNALYGSEIVLGSVKSSLGGAFISNHAGNELMSHPTYVQGEISQVESKILQVWLNSSTDHINGDLSELATGGAIHNGGEYISENDKFEYNHAIGVTAKGGAIFNGADPSLPEYRSIMNLNGLITFTDNYVGEGISANNVDYDNPTNFFYSTTALGGAIYNDSNLNFANGDDDFVFFGSDTTGNYAVATETAAGGAIYNDTNGIVNAIRSNSIFDGNSANALSIGTAMGGAIANYGKMALQGGSFSGNRATSVGGYAYGGAIYNHTNNGDEGKITVEINQNTLFSNNSAGYGGAIFNKGTIDGSVNSNARLEFTGNSASATSGGISMGNSIYNASGATFSLQLTNNAQIDFGTNQSVYNAGTFRITGSNDIPTELSSSTVSTMSGDSTSIALASTLYSAEGSSAYEISRTKLGLTSTGFIDSTAINSAALNDTALKLSNNEIYLLSGSYMNLNSGNDVLVNNNFDVYENANLRYKNQNGNLDYLANTIENEGAVTYYGYADNSDMYIAKALVNSSTLNAAADGLLTNIHVDNLKSKEGNQIVVNLSNSADNPATSKADIVVIDSNIHNDTGTTTKIVFHDLSNNYISQVYLGQDDKIYFAKTQVSQTDYDFDNTFSTTAVNSDYNIKIGYEMNGSVYDWFLYREADIDPAIDPEDMALIDLPRAALEQTRSILLPISRTNRGQCSCYQDNCSNSYCQYESSRSKTRLWATPIFRKGSYDKPIETDFTIKGIDFGMDIQPAHSAMYGFFGSYRNGEYENDGKGKKYFSHFGSELDITSIIGGLYLRKYFGNFYMLGAAYGGKLDVDLKTKTGVKSSVDGYTIGALGEMGYDIRLTHREVLTPSLRATYSYINFSDINDLNGKKGSVDNVNNVELEAALKYEYQFNNQYQLPTTGYIKPSVIQTISTGGKVKVADKEYDDTLENETLGRIELGADAELIRNFSIGAFGNYTFGSEYSAWGVGGNIRYVW